MSNRSVNVGRNRAPMWGYGRSRHLLHARHHTGWASLQFESLEGRIVLTGSSIISLENSELAFEYVPPQASPSVLAVDATWPIEAPIVAHDPVSVASNPLAPPLGTTIEGINFDVDGANHAGRFFIPPDPIGAVGPGHVVSVVNSSIQWHTKAGVLQNNQRLGKDLTGSIVGSFFAPLVPANSTFDPKVIYDQHAGRFVVVTLEQVDSGVSGSDPGNISRVLFAVSDDSDPNGTWHFQALNTKLVDAGGVDRFFDYPGIAVDEEAIYLTGNMFRFSANPSAPGEANLWILNKALYAGGTSTSTNWPRTTFAPNVGSSATTMPAHVYGTPPSGSTGTWLVQYSGLTNFVDEFINTIRIDNPLSATPTFTPQLINVGPIDNVFAAMPDSPQMGSAVLIETNDRRALNAVWRSNSLYTTFQIVPTSGVDASQSTAHWAQINTTTPALLTLTDQGNIGGEDIAPGTRTFMPSIGVDSSGNVGIGFSASAPTIFAGAYYTGRQPGDAAGTVQPSGTLAAGLDTYVRTFGGPRNRWGDYSGISIDPSNDSTFWVFNEYALTQGAPSLTPPETGRWGTRWGSFSFAPAGATLSINDVSINEGNAGNTQFVFTVTLSAAVAGGVNVNFTTANGTATTAGSDYTATSGTLTFAGTAGETETITVNVTGETIVEPNETFFVNLSSVSNPSVTLADGQGQGTILNDDAATLSINDVSINEGNAGATPFVFTVTLNNAVQGGVSVNFATANGTATTAGSDYTANSGTLTFAGTAGETKTITVNVTGDTIVEPNETFLVNLSGVTNPSVTLADAQGQGTIQNDDAATLSINDVSLNEGNAGNTPFVFTVTLNNAVQGGVSVNFATADGTATTVNNDYTANSGTLTFAGTAGETETITVNVIGDTTVEPNETFLVNLSGVTNPSVTLADGQGQGTIQNDDGATLSINDVSINEGNAGTTLFVFTVTLSSGVVGGVTVDFATANGTATATSDYTATSGTLTFAGTAGETETITVNVAGDTTLEPNETFSVNLSNASSAQVTIADALGQGTIQNDDAASLSINDVSANEGNAGNTPFVFTVTLSQAVQGGLTVNFATANGSATASSDYTAASGTLTFAGTAGEQETITVNVTGDTTVEQNETYTVTLSNVSNAAVTLADGVGQGTILNDDAATLSINDVSANEGNSGVTPFVFTVTLSQAVQGGVSVDFATANGSALAGTDYTATSGTRNFAGTAGETQTITVNVTGDTAPELNETFFVNLSNLVSIPSVTFADSQGQGTILNDDAGIPAQTIDNVLPNTAQFSATGSWTYDPAPVPPGFETDLHTSVWGRGENSATWTFTGLVPGQYRVQATWTPSSRRATIAPYTILDGSTPLSTTLVNQQLSPEPDFVQSGVNFQDLNTVTISGNTLAVTLTNSANGYVVADAVRIEPFVPAAPSTLSINDVSLTEGDAGVKQFLFTVTLSNAVSGGVSVNFATANGTATASSDYTATSGTLNFTGTAGETKTVTVNVNGDMVVEPNETFFVNLSNISNPSVAFADSQGLGTIQNDDTATLSINDVSLNEGNAGVTPFVFTVTLNKAVQGGVSVDFATANGTATTANNDYTATNGTLNFTGNAGETKTVTVNVNGDTTVEPNETFVVNLSNVSNASVTLADGQGQGTIVNDDGAALSINDVSLNEGNAGTTAFVFTVTLSDVVVGGVNVNFATANGTATTATSDYTTASGTLIFTGTAGETKTVTVNVSGDMVVEPNETFFVNLSSVSNPLVVLADGQGQGTIQNDDTATLSINDVSLNEGNAGITPFGFTVTLSQAVQGGVTVNFATANGSATASSDYTATSGPLSFTGTAGEQKTVTVNVNGDTAVEPNETFFVNLSGSSQPSVTFADSQGQGTIVNDDAGVPSQIIDNVHPNSAQFTTTGSWTYDPAPVPAGFETDIHTSVWGRGENVATWTFSGLTPGRYMVQATWSPTNRRATTAPYTILDGTTPVSTTLVNQQLTPEPDFVQSGVNFQDLAAANITGSTLVVNLTNNTNGYVVADAIRIEPLGPLQVIDNTAHDGLSFVTNGNWGYAPTPGVAGYQTDINFAAPGNGSNEAIWTFTGLPAGEYLVGATWTPSASRASNAPYTVLDGSTPLFTAAVNQKLAPAPDTTESGVSFQFLGAPVSIASGTLVVKLTNNADGFVIADAIKIHQVTPASAGETGPVDEATLVSPQLASPAEGKPKPAAEKPKDPSAEPVVVKLGLAPTNGTALGIDAGLAVDSTTERNELVWDKAVAELFGKKKKQT